MLAALSLAAALFAAWPAPPVFGNPFANDFRTPIIGPYIPDGRPPHCGDPPDEASIIRALPALADMPPLYRSSHDDVQIVTELVKDVTEEPRYYPLVGPARLRRCLWKCTVFYTETTESEFPFPWRSHRPVVKEVCIEMDHVQPVGQ